MNINEILKEKEYDFIRNQERLGNRIDFLVFGGSVAYGLNGPNSDIDIRGVCSPLRRDILGCGNFTHPYDLLNKNININNGVFEQYLDNTTDTCIYNINKYIQLIYNCNPNTIEMLGCLPEHYTMVSDIGRMLIDSRNIFITKKAFYTFAGYARQQFIRLQNSLVRKSTKLDQILQTISVVKRAYEHLEESFPTFKRDMLELYVVDSTNEKIDIKTTNMFFANVDIDKKKLARELSEDDLKNAELRINLRMNGLSTNDLKGVIGEVSNIINNFSQHTGHRNNKKDEEHEDKHASHLRRLQITCKKIFTNHEIETWCGDDIQELLDIKHGCYRKSDGSYKQEFFDLVNREMDEIQRLYDESDLPPQPDMLKVLDLVMKINEAALSR